MKRFLVGAAVLAIGAAIVLPGIIFAWVGLAILNGNARVRFDQMDAP